MERELQDPIGADLTAQVGASRGNTLGPDRFGKVAAPGMLSTSAGGIELRILKVPGRVALSVAAGSAPSADKAVVGGDHDRLRHRHLYVKSRELVEASGCES